MDDPYIMALPVAILCVISAALPRVRRLKANVIFFILPLLFAFGATNHSLYAIHFINLTSIRSCDIQSNVGVDFLTSENFICYELAQSSSAIPKGIVFLL